jgi:hypothetical protein
MPRTAALFGIASNSAPGATPPPTTSAVGPSSRLPYGPNTAGSASWPFAIPGTASLVGFQFDFQFVSFNVLYVGCPAFPGVAASNIVRVTIDY